MKNAIKSVVAVVVLTVGIGTTTPAVSQVKSQNYDDSATGKAGQALENMVLLNVAEALAKQNILITENPELYLEQAPKLIDYWDGIQKSFAGAKGFDFLDKAMYAHRSMVLYHRTGILTEEIAVALHQESQANLKAYLALFD